MNPLDLLQNAGKVREEIGKMQEQMTRLKAEGSSGGKMVVVTMNGQMEVTAIRIDPICVDARDVKMLEDLIVAACHDAAERIKEKIAETLASNIGQ